MKQPQGQLPFPSTDLLRDVECVSVGDTVRLLLAWDAEGGEDRYALTFHGVRASSHHSEAACSAWHIEGVYDTVCEVTPSDWLVQVRPRVERVWPGVGALSHFMVYLDSDGCHEFLARSWNLEGEAS